MHRLLEKIRLRAYELFEQRGRENGHDVDDWLQAEAEFGLVCFAETEESDKEFRVQIKCGELTAAQLTVYAEPQAITVEGRSVRQNLSSADSAVRENALFGRYELPQAIATDQVSACFENGVLEIVAKKLTASKSDIEDSLPIQSSKRKAKRSKSTAA
jgi:HSP20 family molecular chaperone IbpA